MNRVPYKVRSRGPRFHTLTEEQWELADAAYRRRRAEWDGVWDYTEWEELDDEIRGICGIGFGVFHDWDYPRD